MHILTGKIICGEIYSFYCLAGTFHLTISHQEGGFRCQQCGGFGKEQLFHQGCHWGHCEEGGAHWAVAYICISIVIPDGPNTLSFCIPFSAISCLVISWKGVSSTAFITSSSLLFSTLRAFPIIFSTSHNLHFTNICVYEIFIPHFSNFY